ncbi:hypothetical protein VOLCADRAFT_65342, partial [Volvox carteri f. nagariensis]
IPGNHDWIDGLETFTREIQHQGWLGGWLLPQEKSYFALRLPAGWWLFGFDLALVQDIDMQQYRYFANVVEQRMGPEDQVILMTHEPLWLLEWFWRRPHLGANLRQLVRGHLRGRARVHLAGDLHFYMRHSWRWSRHPHDPQHLVVNGGGGAFLHPTHVSPGPQGEYVCAACYPSPRTSLQLGRKNLHVFRLRNTRFDVIGGVFYFLLVVSVLPRCSHLAEVLEADSPAKAVSLMWSAYTDTLAAIAGRSYLSAGALVVLLLLSLGLARGAHCATHVTFAIVLLLLLELGVETCIKYERLGKDGPNSLYRWYREYEEQHFPDPMGLRQLLQRCTLGLYPGALQLAMGVYDVPELIAVARTTMCEAGGSLESISRLQALSYYAGMLAYYWLLATPAVGFVFGLYLYISVCWFHVHYDEAFSSLREVSCKSFCRLHIGPSGDLQLYTLALDEVPTRWQEDPRWRGRGGGGNPGVVAHEAHYPSRWVPTRAEAGRDAASPIRLPQHPPTPMTPPISRPPPSRPQNGLLQPSSSGTGAAPQQQPISPASSYGNGTAPRRRTRRWPQLVPTCSPQHKV